ncbi:MFS transporter [Sphingomonas sp. C3-2]|nr:MFS transporter [Sphingomonas sp. C3-2]WOK35351.1 MFS transporter [Sphingomonas sp. C3-2]
MSAQAWPGYMHPICQNLLFPGCSLALREAALRPCPLHWPEISRRTFAIGFAGSAGGIAGILALNAGGVLVDVWGWRGPFILYALGAAIFAVAWCDRSAPIAADQPDQKQSGSIRSILHLYLLLFLLSIGFYVPSLFGPFILGEAGIASAADQGFLLSVFAISSILSASMFGFLTRIAATMTAAALAAILLAAGMATMVLTTEKHIIGLGLSLAGMGAGLAAPAVISEILARVTAEARAKAMGLKVTAIFLAQFATPFVLHPIRSHFGLPAAIFAMSGLLVATAFWAVLLRRRQNPAN